MAPITTPVSLLEEASQELTRAQGRVMTAIAGMPQNPITRKKEKITVLSTLQAHLVAVIGSAVALVVGLGVLSPASGGHIVAVAGVALSAIFTIANEIKGTSLAKSGRAAEIK